jgi:hypothetical protein
MDFESKSQGLCCMVLYGNLGPVELEPGVVV